MPSRPHALVLALQQQYLRVSPIAHIRDNLMTIDYPIVLLYIYGQTDVDSYLQQYTRCQVYRYLVLLRRGAGNRDLRDTQKPRDFPILLLLYE